MPRKRDALCAGGCGKLLHGGKGALPPGVRTCQGCRRARREALEAAKPPPIVRARNLGNSCKEPNCQRPAHSLLLCRPHYRKTYGTHWKTGDPERRKARNRARTHKRRLASRFGDVTLDYEQQLRRKAKRCPLCNVRMTDEPYEDNSKELDHMIPLNVGGTHTIGNVRIICRACNQSRPNDGSDYAGAVTLWAEDPGFMHASTPKRRRIPLCPHGAKVGVVRCYTCWPPDIPPRQADGRRAAELHAEGMSWLEIREVLGFSTAPNAKQAALRHGAPEVIARWEQDDPHCLDCGVELPRGGRGRPRKRCSSCVPPKVMATHGDDQGCYTA